MSLTSEPSSEYASLVRTALLSDVYWGLPETVIAEPLTPGDIVGNYQRLQEKTRLVRNTTLAAKIGSIVTSIDEQTSIEAVEWGERIPDLHGRQIVAVVEDSRQVMNKLSWEYLTGRFLEMRYRRAIQRIPGSDYQVPTFEQAIESMDRDSSNPTWFADETVSCGLTRAAFIRRASFYMVRDRNSGLFVAMPAPIRGPRSWERPYLEIIPDAKVGSTYSKNYDGNTNHLGKIIAANIVEAHSVTWQDGDKPSKANRKKRKRTELKSQPAQGKLAFESQG